MVENTHKYFIFCKLKIIQQLTKHSESIINRKLYMGVFDSMLVKYGAFMVGYAVVGLPVFGPGSA